MKLFLSSMHPSTDEALLNLCDDAGERTACIITTAPHEDAEKIRQALGEAGAGSIGDYRYCSFSITGKGRFIPTDQADPHIGEANRLEVVEEDRSKLFVNVIKLSK